MIRRLLTGARRKAAIHSPLLDMAVPATKNLKQAVMHQRSFAFFLLSIVAVSMAIVLSGCAAGDPRFSGDELAGFWVGLWHGMISWITLIIGIFSDSVEVYERNNTGGWYDFGFLLGTLAIWGGNHANPSRRRKVRAQEQQWREIGEKVEAKLRRKIAMWAEAEPDEEWNVVEAKAEAKLKRKVREWAEEQD